MMRWKQITTSVASIDTEEAKKYMANHKEGTFTLLDVRQPKDSMKTVPDVLNMAMMLESQAMDLYMRYSEKAKDEKSKTVLYDIAEEEKAHLKALGHLMEQRA